MDPNRYSKNRDIRPDSPWQLLQAVFTLTLMLLGVIGIAVHVFGNDQGPADWLQWLTASSLNAIMLGVLLVVAVFFHRYISHISNQQRRAASDLPVYALMLIGIYFAYQLATAGHW